MSLTATTSISPITTPAHDQQSKDTIELSRFDALRPASSRKSHDESPALENGLNPAAELKGTTTGFSLRSGAQGDGPEETSSVRTSLINNEEEEEEEFPEGGWEAWRVALGSFLGLFAVFGLCNSLGAVQAHVSIYQLSNKSESQVSWIFSVLLFLMFFLTGLVGPIYDAYGPYQLTIAGTVLWTIGLMATSFCTQFYQFFLAFSVCVGVGGALCMTPLIAILGQWFNKRRATAIGLASVGGSLGGAVYPLMLRKLYSTVGYDWALRILSLICLVLLIASISLMKMRLEPSSDRSVSVWKNLTQASKNMIDYRTLKDLRYTGLVVGNFLGELGTVNGLTFLTSFSLAQGNSEEFSYALLAILNCMGMAGRIIPGITADKFGRFNTVIATSAMAFLTVFAVWLPFGHSKAGLIAFAMTHGFCNGSIVSLSPACCGQISRTKDYGKRYGFMYFIASITILVGVPISGALIRDGKDYTRLIIFDGAVYVATTLALIYSRYAAVGFRWCKW